MWRLNKKQKKKGGKLQLEDLPLVGQTEEVGYKTEELERAYQRHKEKNDGKPSLFWPIF